MTLAITEVGVVRISITEYLSWRVLQDYNAYAVALKSVYDKRPSNPNNTETLTGADYDAVIAAIQQLSELAKNGRVESNGQQNYVSLLNTDMGETLDLIMRSLKAAGINPSSSTNIPEDEKVALIKSWQSLGGYGVEFILQHAVDILQNESQFVTDDGLVVEKSPTRTLQSMVEVEYVKGANDIIFGELSSLEEASRLTKDILSNLTIVQNIANRVTVHNKEPVFSFPPDYTVLYPEDAAEDIWDKAEEIWNPFDPSTFITPDELEDIYHADLANGTNNFIPYADKIIKAVDDADYFQKIYEKCASAYFAQVSAIPSDTATVDAAIQLLTAKASLSAQMAELEALNPDATRNISGTLAAMINAVLQDVNLYFGPLTPSANPNQLQSSLNLWIIDTQNQPPGQGGEETKVQNNISSAIQAAENLNDTQTEDVRRYLYLFEEFYKSAASVLDIMTSLLEKISTNTKG